MDLINQLELKAKKDKKVIVLPEGEDVRIIKASSRILSGNIADIILIGNEEKIKKLASEQNINIDKAKIIDPISSHKKEEYIARLYELRKHKGMTYEEASKKILDSVYFGLMLVKMGVADGLVGGAVYSSANLLRPALQIIKPSSSSSIVSSFFIMKVPNCNFGDNGLFLFADCGLVAHPNATELADIAIQTADVAKDLCNMEPKLALLSFSTKGSAKDSTIDSIKETLNIINSKRPEIKVDGELQVDAAIVPEVALVKAPGSPVPGTANVLIFPDINSGNISYKLVERLANAQAIGPLCCGFAKPVNDLSRGCSVDDIVKAIIITSVQAQTNEAKIYN